ncbi:hypothetical protein PIB30_035854 [Stylosanthes scabra]|uniref:Transcription factor CBF/NF-Y/archaeal histone domain-containing protein n=1 Tax=Stylosanthes scabra TaxID=79078 RepID=A0ABU6RDF9_9FABA|nr:hypothetical protein [Stylosanthes scabra]
MASDSKTENKKKKNNNKAVTKRNSKSITKSKKENKNKNKKEKNVSDNNNNKNKKRENENANKDKKNNNSKKKKLTHSNGTSKHRGRESPVSPSSSTDSPQNREVESVEEEEDNTVVSNGRTDGKKPNTSKRNREEVEDEDDGDAKSNVFPMNRIRTIVKAEDPEMRVSQEAIFVVNKAAEKFLEQFTQDAYVRCVQERRKSLSYNHLAHVVSKQRRYEFISDFVPETVKAEDALRERNSGGNGGN